MGLVIYLWAREREREREREPSFYIEILFDIKNKLAFHQYHSLNTYAIIWFLSGNDSGYSGRKKCTTLSCVWYNKVWGKCYFDSVSVIFYVPSRNNPSGLITLTFMYRYIWSFPGERGWEGWFWYTLGLHWERNHRPKAQCYNPGALW